MVEQPKCSTSPSPHAERHSLPPPFTPRYLARGDGNTLLCSWRSEKLTLFVSWKEEQRLSEEEAQVSPRISTYSPGLQRAPGSTDSFPQELRPHGGTNHRFVLRV